VAKKQLSGSEPWATLLNLFGAFLIISISASILYSLTLKAHDERRRRAELINLLDDKIDAIVTNRLKFGLGGVVSQMDYNALFDALQKDDELWWLDTYPPDHHALCKHLEQAVQRGAHVTILAIAPNSEVATLRANELHVSLNPKTFKERLDIFINDIKDIIERSIGTAGQLRLGIYKDLPCAPMYVFCRNREPQYGFVSWFLTQPTGIDFPHMRWTSGEVPVLKYFCKYMENKWKNSDKFDAENIKIVFKDDFHAGNKGWFLNYWSSNNPQKTNRIENSVMIFEANESDLLDPRREFGAYIDLRDRIYRECTYEVSCKVKSEKQTTMQFKLWLHDTKGKVSNVETPLRTPSTLGETIKLEIKANTTEAIRIHLHNKAGEGKILLNEVVVRKI